jgi:uncharacterized protein YjiS (DUF1127 family)
MQSIIRVFAFAHDAAERRPGHRLVVTLALWHHRHRSRWRLAALDDRELDDVGLSREERRTECQKRFWQA